MHEQDFVKLTNTVYKILDFLPDSDPLKNKAKEKALAVLENLTVVYQVRGLGSCLPAGRSLKTLLSPESQKTLVTLLDDIEVLQHYLTIGKGQGWIDTMNFFILTKEYGFFQATLAKSVMKESIPVADPPRAEVYLSKKDTIEVPKKTDMVTYSKRQDKILQILKEHKKAQVGDLIKELPNITKRTVRRDLDELLKRGEIVRIGDWNQASYQLK